jgi:hypothetical protein
MKIIVRTLVIVLACVAVSLAVWGAVKSGLVSANLPKSPGGGRLTMEGRMGGRTMGERPSGGQLPEGSMPPMREGGRESGEHGSVGVNISANTWRTLGENLVRIALIVLAVAGLQWIRGRLMLSRRRPAASSTSS